MANSSNLAFCLEYSDHKTEMMDAFDDYLRNESMVDVMLSCEGNTIKAHKLVLSAGSVYFRNIFAAFKNPFQFPVLIIKDMPFNDLKAIVEFLYRGEVVVPVEQVESLFKSAQTLFIKGLEKYFNKSTTNNAANHSSNQSPKTNTVSKSNGNGVRRTFKRESVPNKSINVSKSKVKPTPIDRSISMSLRQTQRRDYRQLSNGDFVSDDDISDSEVNAIHLSSMESRKPLSSSLLKSRQIKSELINKYRTDDNSEDNSVINDDDNRSEVMYEMDGPYNDYESDNGHEVASTSQQRSQSFTKSSVRMTPKKSNTSAVNQRISGSNQRPSATIKIKAKPIKSDPDKMSLIQCELCPRVFSQQSSLAIHMRRIHEENKQNVCKICGKQYSWRSGLYKHMKSHRDT